MALVLDGVNQYAELAFGTLSGVQDFSFFAIAKSNANAADSYIYNLCTGDQAFRTIGIRRVSTGESSGRFFPSNTSIAVSDVAKIESTYKKILVTWDTSAKVISVQTDEGIAYTTTGTNAASDIINRLVVGARYDGVGYTTPGAFFSGSVAYPAVWYGTKLSGADVTGLMDGTLKPDELSIAPSHYKPFVGDQTGGIGADYTLFNSPTIDSEDPYATAGPTITGPDSTTEGSATVATGTALDTVTTFSLVSGSYSIGQTIDSATATTLNYVAESGVNLCVPSTPVSGVPLEATISAAGVTPYVVQQKADDGVNPPATRNITLNAEATHEAVQVMISTSNTTDGESVLASSIIAVEDNMQYYAPKSANGMNITWAADGTFTTDADQTETIAVAYFSPATGNWSCIALTIRDTSIIPDGGHLQFNELEFETLQFETLKVN